MSTAKILPKSTTVPMRSAVVPDRFLQANPFKIGQALFSKKTGRLVGKVIDCSKHEMGAVHWAQVAELKGCIFADDLERGWLTTEAPAAPFHLGQRLFKVRSKVSILPVFVGVVKKVFMNEFGGWSAATTFNVLVSHHELTHHEIIIGRREA